MHSIERLVHTAGRFAVGLGIGLALVSAVVIVRTDLGPRPVVTARPVEVVRLDPVVVTISAEGFREARAGAADVAPTFARLPGQDAGPG